MMKIHGTDGITFPDNSQQGTAAFDGVGSLVVAVGANPLPGTLALSGQTVACADYPKLANWARYESGMVATSSGDLATNPAKWYSADGWVTMVIPNWNGSGDFPRPLKTGVTAGAHVNSQNKAHNHGIVTVGAPASGAATGMSAISNGAPAGTISSYMAQEGGAEAYPNHFGVLHCVRYR